MNKAGFAVHSHVCQSERRSTTILVLVQKNRDTDGGGFGISQSRAPNSFQNSNHHYDTSDVVTSLNLE